MNKEFAIYSVQHYEMKTPFGQKVVKVYKAVDKMIQTIPDEIAGEIDKIKQFNCDSFIEGVGQLILNVGGQIVPQARHFEFDEDVKDYQTAFAQFDKYMKREAEEIRKEVAAQESGISTATPADLARIDNMRRGKDGGIILP